MSDAWERCPQCQDMIKRFGRENLKVCDMCMHLYNDEIHCSCGPHSRDGRDE